MEATSLSTLILRDLDRLKSEILQYQESKLWLTPGNVSNAPGNLCLHICGNLKHFVGAILGNTGYVRDREAEFNDSNVSIDKLVENIEETKGVVQTTLSKLTTTTLQQDYPLNVLGSQVQTGQFLQHLYGHLNYHLGQVNYHRRIT